MKNNFVTIKRIVAFCLTIAFMTNNSIYAIAADNSAAFVQPEMDLSGLEDNTSVTYNLLSNEFTYGEDQNVNLSNDIEIEYEPTVSTCDLIGEDNLKPVSDTTDSPYRNVCQLTVKYKDGATIYASGTLVYFDVVLTAGHVVYNEKHGWASSITVTPGRDGENGKPLGQTYATQVTTNNTWITTANYDYDWAILDLAASFSTWQLYACYQSLSVAIGCTVNAIGYPGEKGLYYMYEHSSTIFDAYDLCFDSYYDSMDGESGGAVIDTKTGYLVGIISRGMVDPNTYEPLFNRGVLITQDLFQRIKAHQD